jgi:predicted TIM-barrel fold metal-dependent hydrolase
MSKIQIDVHAHIFNAKDVPIYGIIKNFDIPFVPKIIERPVMAAIGRLVDLYFGAVTDNKKAWRMFNEYEVQNDDNAEEIVDELYNTDSLFHAHIDEAENIIEALTDEELEEYNDEFEEYLEDSNNTFIKSLDNKIIKFIAKKLIKKILKNITNWLKLLTKSRSEVADELISTYKNVDLFVPLMMDMDKWFSGKSDTSFQDQVQYIADIVIEKKGKIHPFIAYDPKRAKQDGIDASISMVKDAIFNKGFIGVKVYPPMGYPASGGDYDQELNALYELCSEHSIPITAHCTPEGMEADEHSGLNADPDYWIPVLDNYPELKLNLAHFGGLDDLLKNGSNSWAAKITSMMSNYENLYADTGHHHLKKRKKRNKILKKLKPLFDGTELENRYLFGTDWHMIVRQSGSKDFLSIYKDFYKKLELNNTELALDKFSGENAVNFLGLKVGEKNRQRLESYYQNNNIPNPIWIGKIE